MFRRDGPFSRFQTAIDGAQVSDQTVTDANPSQFQDDPLIFANFDPDVTFGWTLDFDGPSSGFAIDLVAGEVPDDAPVATPPGNVPEPAGLSLFGFGALAALFARRRKRAQAG